MSDRTVTDLILASASKHRAKLLQNAGLNFVQIPSDLDERILEAPLEETGVLPKERAHILAEAKGRDVSQKNPDQLVIGCDQILSLDNEVLHKCSDMEQARRRLLQLSGKTHMLHSAVTVCKNDETLWHCVIPCEMTMRNLSPAYIGHYLARVGSDVLSSVGAYQIEGPGAQLFEKVSGDLFSIVGMPLLPLLRQLRELGAIDG